MKKVVKDIIPEKYVDKELEKLYIEERREQIYQQIKLRSRVRKVNAMLRALKKEEWYDESVAVDNLMNYVTSDVVDSTITKSGYISLKGLKSSSQIQLAGLNKAIGQFIKNKTSTPSGMEKLYEERRSELLTMFDDKDFINNLFIKDLRTIYEVFKSNQYEKLQGRMGSPEFFTLYTQAIDEKRDKEWFMKQLDYYVDFGNDLDLRESTEELYDRFISRWNGR